MNGAPTAAYPQNWNQHIELLGALGMHYEQGGKEQDEAWRNVTDEDAEMWRQIAADKEARRSPPEQCDDEYPEEMDEDDRMAAAIAPYEADTPEHTPSPRSLEVRDRNNSRTRVRMVLVL
jgi:hypothetical protein